MEQDFAKRRMRTPLAEPAPVAQSSSISLLLVGGVTGVFLGLFIGLLIYLSGVLPPAPGQAPLTAEREIQTPAVAAAGAAGELTVEQQREAQRLQLEFYQELPNYEVVVDVTPVAGAVPRTPVAPMPSTQVPAIQTPATQAPDSPSISSSTSSSSSDASAGTTVSTAPTPANAAPLTSAPALDPVSAALLEISNRSAPASSAPASPASPTEASPAAAISGAVTGSGFMLQAGAFQQQATAQAQLNRLLGLGLNARIRQENLPGRTLYLVQAGPYASRDDMMQAERVLRSNSIDSMRITLSPP